MQIAMERIVPRYARENNPNVMEPERYERLVEFIRREGFLQPILVRPLWTGGETDASGNETMIEGRHGFFEIIDGHHRWWAAQEAGVKEIDAEVRSYDDDKTAAISIGLNIMRGHPDLGRVAKVLEEVAIEWSPEQLGVYTGFTQAELDELLAAATPEQPFEGGAAPPLDDEAPVPDKPFVLEVAFATKDQMVAVKRKLRKAAGKNKDLALGLLNVLGLIEEKKA